MIGIACPAHHHRATESLRAPFGDGADHQRLLTTGYHIAKQGTQRTGAEYGHANDDIYGVNAKHIETANANLADKDVQTFRTLHDYTFFCLFLTPLQPEMGHL
jgi:hypothetical protein